MDIRTIDMNLIDPTTCVIRHSSGPDNDGTGLAELSASLAKNKLLQPVTVMAFKNPKDNGKQYGLVMGHRRFAAAQTLGWNEIDCIIRTDLHTESEALDCVIDENEQRKDFTHTERAEAEARLKRAYAEEGRIAYYHATTGQVVNPREPNFGELRSKEKGVSRATIDNLVALGEAQPCTRYALDTGILRGDGAYSVSRIDPALQEPVINYLVEKGVTKATPDEVHTALIAVAERTDVIPVKAEVVHQPKPKVKRLTPIKRLTEASRILEAAEPHMGGYYLSQETYNALKENLHSPQGRNRTG